MSTQARIPSGAVTRSDHSQPRPVEHPNPSEPPRDPRELPATVEYLRQKEKEIREATL